MTTKSTPGPKLKPFSLSPGDVGKLQLLARRPKTSQRAAMRARIVLLAGQGLKNHEIAAKVGVKRGTVGKWRERYRLHGIEGLVDEPRPGAPRRVSDAKVEEVVTKTLETMPRGETHWSTRSMAGAAGTSRATVHRIWQAFGLKPHQVKSFKLSPDPLFVEKVRDIVGLYMTPPAHAIVLCLDEKSQIQALNRTQPMLPLRPGIPAHQTHDYERNGTTSLFAALNVHTGEVVGKCYRQHRATEYLRFLRLLNDSLPDDGREIHLVVDNYATHKTPAVKRWFASHPRYHVHFTPTYASWINLVERLFAEVTAKAIRRGSFQSVRALEAAIKEYLDARNVKPFVWTASADEILAKVARFCTSISETGH